MLNLQRTAMFIAVADTGSFTAAAEGDGADKAVVSFHIRQLEEELGVTLIAANHPTPDADRSGEALSSTKRDAVTGCRAIAG